MNNNTVYQCPYCDKVSDFESSIAMHLRICDKRKPNQPTTTNVIIKLVGKHGYESKQPA